MDYRTVSAEDFGRSLKGFGVNILVKDTKRLAEFLAEVFGLTVLRCSMDFAILEYYGQLLQLHSDHTYHSHPLPSLLPELGPRGAGIELRLYESDPDLAVERVKASPHKATILAAPQDKPHGLRECVILCENGYAWVPSRRLKTF